MKHPPQDWMFEGSWVDGDYDIVVLYDGRWLHTHGSKKCGGNPCPIHNQSDHHMRSWPQNWRPDCRLMERMCEHEIGHPDPDGLRSFTGHTCDGCCADPRGGTFSVLASR